MKYSINKDFWPYVNEHCGMHVIGPYPKGGYAVYKPVFTPEAASEVMRMVDGAFMAKTSDLEWTDVPIEEILQ